MSGDGFCQLVRCGFCHSSAGQLVAAYVHVLKAQVAVQVAITFQGGLYRDTDFGPLTHVEITAIEKDNGKEPVNG